MFTSRRPARRSGRPARSLGPRVAVLTGVAFGVAALTACSSVAAPSDASATATAGRAEATGIASAVGTTSSAPVKPTPTNRPDLPTAALERTTEGSQAFASHMLALMNRELTTPVVGLFGPYSSAACQGCAEIDSQASKLAAAHRRWNGPRFDPAGITPNVHDVPGSDQRRMNIQVKGTGAQVVDSRNKVVDPTTTKDLIFEFDMTWADNGWWLTEVWIWKPNAKS